MLISVNECDIISKRKGEIVEKKQENADYFCPEFGMPMSRVSELLEEAEDDFKNGRSMTLEEFRERVKKDYGIILDSSF